VLVTIRQDSGHPEIVAIGHSGSLGNLRNSPRLGGEISLLGRPTRIDGRPLIVAQQVHADGTTVQVDPSPSAPRAASEFHQTCQDFQSAREASATAQRE
jgi:hypothetical protein